MRHVLIDANHLAMRCKWGIPNITAGGKIKHHVIYGFLRSIQYVQNQCVVFPENIVAFWDAGKAPERVALVPDYKAPFRVRELSPDDEEFERRYYEQVDALQEILPDFGVRTLTVEGVEADDLIAFSVDELKKENHQSVIFSGDRDFYQLICEDVNVFDAKEKWVDEKKVARSYGTQPPLNVNFLRARALAGDKSDSIQGVHGIGIKKALQLLPYWDFIWTDEEVFVKNTVRKNLQMARDQRENLRAALRCIELPTQLFSETKENALRGAVRKILFEEKPKRDQDKMTQHLMDWEITTL